MHISNLEVIFKWKEWGNIYTVSAINPATTPILKPLARQVPLKKIRSTDDGLIPSSIWFTYKQSSRCKSNQTKLNRSSESPVPLSLTKGKSVFLWRWLQIFIQVFQQHNNGRRCCTNKHIKLTIWTPSRSARVMKTKNVAMMTEINGAIAGSQNNFLFFFP